jgi:hypothetical protein
LTDTFTYPYEIGHLLGARHDPAVDASNSPYPYGHGFVNIGKLCWNGKLRSGGDASFVASNGDIMGVIRDGSQVYTLDPLGGSVHALVSVDIAQFPPSDRPAPLPQAARERQNAMSSVGGADPLPDNDAARLEVSQDNTVVDVLVPYTTAAKNAVGASNIASHIQLAVDSANIAYVNSGIGLTLRLVGSMEVTGYTENASGSNAFNTALNDVTNGSGVMAAVHTRRNQLGADIVALLINDSSSCGLAWVNSTAARAFSVIAAGSCAVANLAFVHEIGHNFGALHDPADDPDDEPYAYGHGYVNRTSGSGWRTIMASSISCNSACPRIQYFSNPNVNYQGSPTGTAALHDNARVHRERMATIANFRPTPTNSPLVAATLPSSRSVRVGQSAAAFATMVNSGATALNDCGPVASTSVPATFSFQTTNSATNALSGTPNARVSIPAGGTQSFVVAYQANGAMAPTDVAMNFGCAGVSAANSIVGINTLLLAFSTTPVADMVAVGLSTSNDGYLRLGSGPKAFVIATSNVGAAAPMGAQLRPYSPALPLVATVCETNPSTGVCKAPPSSAGVARSVAAGETATWAAFVTATGPIANDPAYNRVEFVFYDNLGVVRGSTSIAVTTQ